MISRVRLALMYALAGGGGAFMSAPKYFSLGALMLAAALVLALWEFWRG